MSKKQSNLKLTGGEYPFAFGLLSVRTFQWHV
jgi:hypothetical protein